TTGSDRRRRRRFRTERRHDHVRIRRLEAALRRQHRCRGACRHLAQLAAAEGRPPRDPRGRRMTLTRRFRDLHIRQKLTWVNVITSALTLALACIAFVAYEVQTYRASTFQNVTTQAEIVGY